MLEETPSSGASSSGASSIFSFFTFVIVLMTPLGFFNISSWSLGTIAFMTFVDLGAMMGRCRRNGPGRLVLDPK